MQRLIGRFAWDDSGANALEYAVIMVLVSLGIVTGATTLGADISSLFSSTGAALVAVSLPSL